MQITSKKWIGLACLVAAAPLAAQEAAEPDGREVLNRAAAFYASLEGIRVHVRMETKTEMMGVENESKEECELIVAGPNRVSARYSGDEAGELRFVSDGARLVQYFGMTDMYFEQESPATLSGITEVGAFGQPTEISLVAMMPHLAVLSMMGDIEGSLLVGATDVRAVGVERVGEQQTRRITIESESMDVNLWFLKGEEPWLVQVSPDMTKMLAEFADMPGADANEFPKIETMIRFEKWEKNPEFGPDAFAFNPPDTATRVDSVEEMFDMGFGEMAEAELLGREAPALELALLDGGNMSLSQHKGKDIVVLDFWATWCPPCVEGLPIVAEVTGGLADQGVVFYAVNQQESPQLVRAFIEKHELEIAVAMDPDDQSSGPYGITAIPQTIIIDKEGLVQAVHVGLLPNLEDRLAEELETLIEGGSLVDPAPERADEGVDRSLSMALEQAWSVPGAWSGVDSRGGEVYAAKSFSSRGAVFDADGEQTRPLKALRGKFGAVLRLANLDDDDALEFVTFTQWQEPVRALDDDGSTLWSYPADDGVDDAWIGDINGDGVDEIAIGFNGGTGVHLVDASGDPLWKNTSIGNVWHVCFGDADGDGESEIITSSAAGQVHVFSAAGERVRNLRAGVYANMVRTATTTRGETIAVVGGGPVFVGINFDGDRLWKTRAPGVDGGAHLVAAEAAPPGRPWLAAGFAGGPIVVVDVDTGTVIASFDAPDVVDVCWLETEDGPLLVFTTRARLEARRLVPTGDEMDR